MLKSVIENVHALEIYDSRGNPTVEAFVTLSNGVVGKAEVPSGASTGENEAVELRDGGDRVGGKGVSKAVNNVNTKIAEALKGLDPHDQANIDRVMIELDGTPNKAELGANAILGVSMATADAAAKDSNQPLYRYLGGTDLEMPQTFHNVINGGEHADNGIDVQEFMITPVKKTGFAPNMKNSEEALQALHEAIIKAGYKPGEDIAIACDCAASYFYNKEDGKYHFEGKVFDDDQLAEYYDKLLDEFPELISIEDPYDENDVEGMIKFTQSHKDRIQIVLDDFICTNPKLLTKAIKEGAGNASLIKLNQIGTVTETLETIRLSRKNGYNTMISHRSGETGDTFIADFAVAVNGGQLKTGAPARSERVEKYNRLLEIEEELGEGERLATFPDSVDKD